MKIAGRFLIHFKSGIAVSEQSIFIFDGNHIFFHQNMIVASGIDFNIVGTQINAECVVSQSVNSFLR